MSQFFDAVLPSRCAACASPARGLCTTCMVAADALRLPVSKLDLLAEGVAATGVYAYDAVIRDAVHGMKIAGRFDAARHLSGALRAHPALPLDWLVTWVPSTRRRRRGRGFELPQLLAGPKAMPLLTRILDRPDQTTLSPAQRRLSPIGVFRAARTPPADVVLVDDVRTTGATALAAASALLDAGAARVLVVTLAVGGDEARAGLRSQ